MKSVKSRVRFTVEPDLIFIFFPTVGLLRGGGSRQATILTPTHQARLTLWLSSDQSTTSPLTGVLNHGSTVMRVFRSWMSLHASTQLVPPVNHKGQRSSMLRSPAIKQ